ncbi:MAG: hypothetical protein LBB18_02350 [Puniceicoccales bacterium]|jgi:hypothetical protein|nr:hypothetical protein [Puniceicoccales bacterium]
MIVIIFAILHYLVIFFFQVLNNTTVLSSMPVIPVGLFVRGPIVYLDTKKAIALYCLSGFTLDALFPFCPFGFSTIFFIFFYCAQRLILNADYPVVGHCGMAFEQMASLLYVIFLLIFCRAPFSTHKFLLLGTFSQIFTLILSKKMSLLHTKIAAMCDNYAKYRK